MKFQLIGSTYRNNWGKPCVTMYGRQADGKSVSHSVEGFRPYFYVLPRDRGACEDFLRELPEVTDVCEEYRYIPRYGYQTERSEVLQVFVNKPGDVPAIRDMVASHESVREIFEADVLFASARFLTDYDLRGMGWVEVEHGRIRPRHDITENAPLRYLGFDLEVLPPKQGVPDAHNDPIIMVSVSFSDGDSVVLVGREGSDDDTTSYFSDEQGMLEEFIRIVQDYDPDVVAGYNSSIFDWPYLQTRMQVLGMPNEGFGRDGSGAMVRAFAGKKEVYIVGRATIDLIDAIKANYSLTSYSLDNVSQELLQRPKLGIKASEMRNIWLQGNADDVGRFIEYARRDAVLLQDMMSELKIIDRYIAISRESGCLLHDTINSGQSKKIEAMLLREFTKEGWLFPMRGATQEEHEVLGGHVFEPERGLHEHIIVMDYKSLYPSAIRAYNICWTTILNDARDVKVLTAPNDVSYVDHSVRQGIMPRILTHLYEERLVFKKRMREAKTKQDVDFYDAQQYAVKILLNSFYGYTGARTSRLYDTRLANSVTSVGRKTAIMTKEVAESMFGCKSVGGDSITGDRYVVIKDEFGVIGITKISKLFDEGDSIPVDFTDKDYRIPRDTSFALTHDGWHEITAIMRHYTEKNIYRVVQKYGVTVATEDHSIMSKDMEKIKPTDLQHTPILRCEISRSDLVIDSIDLYELVKHFEIVSNTGRVSRFMVTSDGKHLTFGWMNVKVPVMVKRFISGPDMDSLCILLAGYITNGSATVGSSRVGASICDPDVAWLTKMQTAYYSLFDNVKTCIIRSNKKTSDPTMKLQMMNMVSSAVFAALCGHGARDKRLPNFIYNLDERLQRLFLDVLIEGDGSRRIKGKISDTRFDYTTISTALASGMSVLLSLLDINHSFKFREDKHAYSIRNVTEQEGIVNTKIIPEETSRYVYDLTVDGAHTFVDACGLICLSNTDSAFLAVPTENKDEGRQIAKKIHDHMIMLLPPPMEIDFECWCERAIFFEKKRYAMWIFEQNQDGTWHDKMKYRGIEIRRRDWVPLVGETMGVVLEKILKRGDVKGAWEHARGVVARVEKLHNIAHDPELANKLVLSRKVGDLDGYKNVQPHVVVCRKMEARGDQPFGLGDRARYMALPGALKRGISEMVDTPEYILEHGGMIDTKWYVEKQLLPPLERIFAAVGIDMASGRKVAKETSLFSFGGSDVVEDVEVVMSEKSVEVIKSVKCGLFSFT